MRSLLVPALIASLFATMAAQQPRPAFPTGTASISGRVTDSANGQPVSGATVTLSTEGPPAGILIGPRTTTAADGTFHFGAAPSVPLRIEATKTGYGFGAYGKKRANGSGLTLTIAEGTDAQGIVIPLWPRAGVATLSGSVTDESGRPIKGLALRALRRTGATGRWAYETAGSTATTDANGDYLLGVPSAGTYIIETLPLTDTYPIPSIPPNAQSTQSDRRRDITFLTDRTGEFMQTSRQLVPPPPDRQGRPRAYLPAFYGGDRSESATPITLTASQSRSALNITLPARPAVRVAGTLIGPHGPVDAGELRLLTEDGLPLSAQEGWIGRSRPDGHFAFALVPPGTYTLEGQLRLPAMYVGVSAEGFPSVGQNDVIMADPESLWIHETVTIPDRDVSDLVWTMRPGVQTSVSVVPDLPDAALSSTDLQRLRPILGLPDRTYDRILAVSVKPGQFVFRSAPGRFVPNLEGVPNGWVLAAITRNGTDVMGKLIEIGADSAPDLRMVISYRPARVTGTIVDPGGRASSDASVILFPADRSTWQTSARSQNQFRLQRTGTGHTPSSGCRPAIFSCSRSTTPRSMGGPMQACWSAWRPPLGE